ncbi:cysteine hydrolase [Mesorhizobium sp. B3-1-7]|nr:cysteine hydrolase [Mesorhizobium sp. B3-1-7]
MVRTRNTRLSLSHQRVQPDAGFRHANCFSRFRTRRDLKAKYFGSALTDLGESRPYLRKHAADVTPLGPWAVEWLPATSSQAGAQATGSHDLHQVHPGVESGQRPWSVEYEPLAEMTIARAGKEMVELLPELAIHIPPACLFDKPIYSPWLSGELARVLQSEGVEEVIVSGGEADMCVLANLLGSVDLDYRTILAEDAICSTSDEAYENILKLFTKRYSHHVEVAPVDAILGYWH